MRSIRDIGMRRLDGLDVASGVGVQSVAGDRTIAVRIDPAKIGFLIFRQLVTNDFAVFICIETSEQIGLGLLSKSGHYTECRSQQRTEFHEGFHHDLLESQGMRESLRLGGEIANCGTGTTSTRIITSSEKRCFSA